jgi:hypothetical protein
MKRNLYLHRLAIALTIAFLVFACQKSITTVIPINPVIPSPANHPDSLSHPDSSVVPRTDTTIAPHNPAPIPYPVVVNYTCNGPDYGDSIIYPKPVGFQQSYIVSPINNPGAGKYFSWPDGLSLNASTGAINVTQSETGLRYSIGFVKSGTTDTCLKTIILAGAAYTDGVYVLANGQTTASPYYNADPSLISVCSGSATPGGPGCRWDITGQAQMRRITVNNQTGVIDLQKTLNDGAFGLLLLNGASVQATLSYQLNDASNMATQTMPLKLMYYNRKSDVPQSLLDQVSNRQTNIVQQLLILLGGNPRPPMIIITRYN